MADDVAEGLIERQRLRRRLMFWRVAFVAVLAVAGIVGFAQIEQAPSGDYVAVLDIGGVIETDRTRDDALDQIATDNQAKALLLRINSPGGTFVGGEALYVALQRVAAEKPVVVVMDDVAASAGYMIAMAGDHLSVEVSVDDGQRHALKVFEGCQHALVAGGRERLAVEGVNLFAAQPKAFADSQQDFLLLFMGQGQAT